VTRYFVDRVQNCQITDSLFLQGFHESAACAAILLEIYWSSHQFSEESRIA
jgi:hypothetical protein